MSDGIDCLSPISAAQALQLYRDGRTFALRYIGTKGAQSLSTAEVARLHAAGLDVGLIYETSGMAALAGSQAGGILAGRAAGAARTLGVPEGTAVFLAETDFDVQPEQVSAVRAFYSVAADVLALAGYRCGAYGGLLAMQALAGMNVLRWQTYAWSHGQWAEQLVLQQYANGVELHGLNVDLDRALLNDWGQWAPIDPPHPLIEEDRMDYVIIATQDANGQSTGTYLVYSPKGASAGITAENAPTVPHVTMTADGYNQYMAQLQKPAAVGA